MRKPRLLALAAGLMLAVAGPTLSASAHAGGKAQLYLKKVSAVPSQTSGSYDLTIEIIDRDSGEPSSGYAVSVEGTGGDGQTIPPTATTALNGGKYTASVPAAPGEWNLVIRGNGAPGVGEAVPLSTTQSIPFPDPARSAGTGGGGDDGGGGGAAGAIVAVVAVLVLLGVGGAFMMKRKAGRLAGAAG